MIYCLLAIYIGEWGGAVQAPSKLNKWVRIEKQ